MSGLHRVSMSMVSLPAISARIIRKRFAAIPHAANLLWTGYPPADGGNRMISGDPLSFSPLLLQIMYMERSSPLMADGWEDNMKKEYMDIRFEHSPKEVRGITPEKLRSPFLSARLMQEDPIRLVYTPYDRVIMGGVKPVKQQLSLET